VIPRDEPSIPPAKVEEEVFVTMRLVTVVEPRYAVVVGAESEPVPVRVNPFDE
jgi:hypothetical protein